MKDYNLYYFHPDETMFQELFFFLPIHNFLKCYCEKICPSKQLYKNRTKAYDLPISMTSN